MLELVVSNLDFYRTILKVAVAFLTSENTGNVRFFFPPDDKCMKIASAKYLIEFNGCWCHFNVRCCYEASSQSQHCSLTMVQHRVVKCVSGGKMCLATLSQIVTCSVKSPGSSFILNTGGLDGTKERC